MGTVLLQDFDLSDTTKRSQTIPNSPTHTDYDKHTRHYHMRKDRYGHDDDDNVMHMQVLVVLLSPGLYKDIRVYSQHQKKR
jgi:hypothetical protein